MQTRFKVGDVVKFVPEWAGNPKQQFIVTAVHDYHYDLKEFEHGFWDLGDDENLEPGDRFIAEINSIYAKHPTKDEPEQD